MSEADLHAAALVKSKDAAERDALIDAEAKRLVALKVTNELAAVTTDEKGRFLECLEACGNVSKACRAVGISRVTANEIRKRDALFALAWSEILESHIDDIEEAMVQRAKDPSTAATVAGIFMLKARRRDRYAENLPTEHAAAKVRVVVELVPPRDAPHMLDVVDAELVSDVPAGDDE